MTLYIICLFIPVLVLILLFLNVLLAPSKPDHEKMSSYECGFISDNTTRSQFQIAFYIVAILFLIFDLEVLLFYPLAACLSQVSTYGFTIGIIFIGILTIGFVFEYGSGAIIFTSKNSSHILYPLYFPFLFLFLIGRRNITKRKEKTKSTDN